VLRQRASTRSVEVPPETGSTRTATYSPGRARLSCQSVSRAFPGSGVASLPVHVFARPCWPETRTAAATGGARPYWPLR
jgi:hypothetical protein